LETTKLVAMVQAVTAKDECGRSLQGSAY
jgi:hypothetical protein